MSDVGFKKNSASNKILTQKKEIPKILSRVRHFGRQPQQQQQNKPIPGLSINLIRLSHHEDFNGLFHASLGSNRLQL